MAAWIGPTIAISLLIIALCVLSVGWSLYAEIKHARTQRAKLAAAATCCQG